MHPASASVLGRYPAPRHRLTRADYYRLGEAGILKRDDRVELLDGQLIDMPPIRPRDALVIQALNELLVRGFSGRAAVRCQLPVTLDDGSEPQPDFALVRRRWDGYPHAHPRADDVFLLIEVSDSSLDFDRTVKLELYCRAGVREVWIVDLTSDAVEVYRAPSGSGYGAVARVVSPGRLEVEALPGVAVEVGAVFS